MPTRISLLSSWVLDEGWACDPPWTNQKSEIEALRCCINEARSLGAVGRIMAPKEVHVLISGTYEHVTLCSKRDFADVMKNLTTGKLSWIV